MDCVEEKYNVPTIEIDLDNWKNISKEERKKWWDSATPKE